MTFKKNQVFERTIIEKLSKLCYSIRFQHVRVFVIKGSNKEQLYEYFKDLGYVFEGEFIKTIKSDNIIFSTQQDDIISEMHSLDINDVILEEVLAISDNDGSYFMTIVERLKALSQHIDDTDILLAAIIAETELGKLMDDIENERLYANFNDKFIQTMMNHIIDISELNDIDLLNKTILEAVINLEFYIFDDRFESIVNEDYLVKKLGFIK
ncbi:MAG: hypothetical protein RBT45_03970 [Acholeplasmataceae bacterium]|jgi:hypothetical protein|nr:hypothetical protein [Acholeplasmataceae bacterium]